VIGVLSAGVFYVALIYVLVRPGSRGADAIQNFGDMMGKLIQTATDIANEPREESTEFDGETVDGNIDVTDQGV
jgi:hypothetical protein